MNKFKMIGKDRVRFHCPGCMVSTYRGEADSDKEYDCTPWHEVPVYREGEPKNGWLWNGDMERPTLSPSVRVTKGDPSLHTCHFFVRNGQAQYCGDSTHELASKTVEMLDVKGLP